MSKNNPRQVDDRREAGVGNHDDRQYRVIMGSTLIQLEAAQVLHCSRATDVEDEPADEFGKQVSRPSD